MSAKTPKKGLFTPTPESKQKEEYNKIVNSSDTVTKIKKPQPKIKLTMPGEKKSESPKEKSVEGDVKPKFKESSFEELLSEVKSNIQKAREKKQSIPNPTTTEKTQEQPKKPIKLTEKQPQPTKSFSTTTKEQKQQPKSRVLKKPAQSDVKPIQQSSQPRQVQQQPQPQQPQPQQPQPQQPQPQPKPQIKRSANESIPEPKPIPTPDPNIKYNSDERNLIKSQKRQLAEYRTAYDMQRNKIYELESELDRNDLLINRIKNQANKLNEDLQKAKTLVENSNAIIDKAKKELEAEHLKEIQEKDRTIRELENNMRKLHDHFKSKLTDALKDKEKELQSFQKEVQEISNLKDEEYKEIIENLKNEKEILQQDKEKFAKNIDDVRKAYHESVEETEGYKQRLQQKVEEKLKYASLNLVSDLVEMLDNLDKIVNTEVDDPKIKNYLTGFKMINDSLFDILKADGLEEVATNIEFDPNLHNAKEKDFNKELPEGSILETFKKGYKYKGRLIRAADVKVNQK